MANTDPIAQCGDSDSDSGSKWRNWRRSQFWYEVPGLRDIPDYRAPASYPWEKLKKKNKETLYFLIVRDKSWSKLSEKQRTSRCNPQCWTRSESIADSRCLETVADAQPQKLCSSAEVLRVRLEMHKCFEEGVSLHRLFESKAKKEELRFQNVNDEPYMLFVSRCQRESTIFSYPHVFPKLNEVEPLISCKWVKPSTLEGDKQYLEFFPKLIQAAEYGETKDNVLAKAIVLATKLFPKMLYFQIDIAVQDCIELKKNEERMKQRYDLYYFTVCEIVLNGKDLKSVLDDIRDGYTGLPYDLTEFGSYNTDTWEGVIADIVDHIVTHLRSQRECLYKDWVFDKVDKHVAEFVYETLNKQLGPRCHLYVDFLKKKIKVAQDLGLL
ncbi:unnamed protein product [Urochloa decumbens]|uniref:Uncharacterized protein n=1 Tax=Urochloa decumbens TaxID=240449 RepID=A0ABC8VBN3_9POAL